MSRVFSLVVSATCGQLLSNVPTISANIQDADIFQKGPTGQCSPLLDFLKSRSGADFPNLTEYPITNYRIKHKVRGDKTKGIVMCKRLQRRKALPEDLASYNSKKAGPRGETKGRFMCVDGNWTADWHRNGDNWDIPMCPDRDEPGAWAEFHPVDADISSIDGPSTTQAPTTQETTTISFEKQCHEIWAQDVSFCDQCCSDRWMDSEDFDKVNNCYDQCDVNSNVEETTSYPETTVTQPLPLTCGADIVCDSYPCDVTSCHLCCFDEAGNNTERMDVCYSDCNTAASNWDASNLPSEEVLEDPSITDQCVSDNPCTSFPCDTNNCHFCCHGHYSDDQLSKDNCYDTCNDNATSWNAENATESSDGEDGEHAANAYVDPYSETCAETNTCDSTPCEPVMCQVCCYSRYFEVNDDVLNNCYAECTVATDAYNASLGAGILVEYSSKIFKVFLTR